MKNQSEHPCPICKKISYIVGTDNKGKKIGSCGHTWSFKKTRSQKEMDRKFITTAWGLERIK